MAAPPRPNELPPDRLSAARDEGEYFDLADDPDEVEIVETDPGAAFADLPGQREESTPPDEGFYKNLAELLPPNIKDQISTSLIRLIEMDKESRAKRDEQYEEGIKRTGMGKDAPGGAAFEGASRVVHPMITEACIDYQSRIMKEIFPPSGPAKPSMIGAVTKRKTEKARRVSEHMNYQITRQIKGARTTLEVLFAQVPLGGSQYIRQHWDHGAKRPDWQFASVDRVLVPFAAADFASAKRKTFIDTIDEVEFKKRIAMGMYLDLDLPRMSQVSERTRSEKASEKVEGVEDPGLNLDGDRDLYETMTYLEVTEAMLEAFGEDPKEEQDEMAPYLVTIDVASKQMLSMYRCWEDGDSDREPIEHLFEFSFIPWRGPYGIGFPQIIGGLSGAATGALRGLLDSAHVNNIPSGLILKGSGIGGQSRMPSPGELVEIEAGTETDDVRKRVMPMPFNPPSSVLFSLLGFLVDAAKGVVRTSLDETPQNTAPNTPVGTQISRVEEGLVVFSAIHGRAHAGMDRLLRGLHRLNRLYLPEEVKVDAAGEEIMVSREDYEGPCDVMPVSDPTIYSDLQRFGQIAAIQQRQMVVPTLYKAYAVEEAFLKLIKWPDPKSLLNEIPEAKEENAVNENLRMVLGQPVAVYPDQDHLAHIQVLLDFMKSPALGANPLFAPTFLPAALKHGMEHIAYYYATHTEATVTQAAGAAQQELAGDEPEVKQAFDKLLAQASQSVVPEIMRALQGVLPVLAQAMAQVKALQPPPPMDPATAAVQAAAAETQRKTADDQAGHQLDAAKQTSDTQIAQQKNAIAAAAVNAKTSGDQLASDTKLATTDRDNATALEISESKVDSGQVSRFTNGQSMTRQ